MNNRYIRIYSKKENEVNYHIDIEGDVVKGENARLRIWGSQVLISSYMELSSFIYTAQIPAKDPESSPRAL